MGMMTMTESELYAALIAANVRLADPVNRIKEEKKNEIDRKSYKESLCPKCNGKGSLTGYQHHCGGVCFRCNGTGNKHNA